MNKSLNGFQLKIIAITIMVIDHAGLLFFPDIIVFRIIGRLSFPIFAFLISEGFRYTRSVKKYLVRLGVCAVLFQIPDWFSTIYGYYINDPNFGVHYVFNIFATLFFGLLAITLFDKLKERSLLLSWLAASAVALIAEFTGADYGAYGVLYVVVFYLASGNIKAMFVGVLILHGAYGAYEMLSGFIQKGTAVFTHSMQLYSMLSMLPISLYNQQQGRKMKYFFYAFYPAHMIILYIIDFFLRR